MQQLGPVKEAQALQLVRSLVRTGDGIVDVCERRCVNFIKHLTSSGFDDGKRSDAAADAPLAPNELMHLRTPRPRSLNR